MLDPFELFQELFIASPGKLHGQVMVLAKEIQVPLPAGRNDIIDSSRKIVRDILRQHGNPDIGTFDDLAAIGGDFAVEHLHQGRLACPVPAQETDAFAFFNRERRTVQKKRPAKAHRHVVDPDHCHNKTLYLHQEEPPALPAYYQNIAVAFNRI